MNEQLHAAYTEMMSSFIAYFPKLMVGIILLIIGWVLAWFVKRIIVNLSAVLKLDQFLSRSRWKITFARADVRYGFYNFVGNIFFFVVFLIFLDFALNALGLIFFSDFLKRTILFFPRLFTAILIITIGWFLSRFAANTLNRTLSSDNIPYAAQISHYAQIMLLVLFVAISLAELNIARGIVLIGFATIFIMLATIAVIMTAMIGKHIIGNSKENNKCERIIDEEIR